VTHTTVFQTMQSKRDSTHSNRLEIPECASRIPIVVPWQGFGRFIHLGRILNKPPPRVGLIARRPNYIALVVRDDLPLLLLIESHHLVRDAMLERAWRGRCRVHGVGSRVRDEPKHVLARVLGRDELPVDIVAGGEESHDMFIAVCSSASEEPTANRRDTIGSLFKWRGHDI